MKVIGFSGQAQYGKDTCADFIKTKLGDSWVRASFAAPIKKLFEEIFFVDDVFIDNWKTKDDIPEGFQKTIRKSLQFIGDGFREIRPTVWLDIPFKSPKDKIISDVRYFNEARRIYDEKGINCLLSRLEKLNNDPNPSESGLRPLIDWLNDYFDVKNVSCQVIKLRGMNLSSALNSEGKAPPAEINLFDYFIVNNSSEEMLFEVLESHLIPDIIQYQNISE